MFHLFIGFGRLDNLVLVQGIQKDREIKANIHITDFKKLLIGKKSSLPGNVGGTEITESNTLTVKHLKILKLFNCMTYGMTKIQKSPFPFFCRIFFNNCFFDLHAFQNHRSQDRHLAILDLRHLVDAPFIIGSVFDQTML